MDMEISGLTKRNGGGTLLDAHKQWATRPADEAVHTVEELLRRASAAKENSREITAVAWDSLAVQVDADDQLVLTRRGPGDLRFTNYSLEQFSRLPAGGSVLAPFDFLSKLSAHGAAAVLNERLQDGVERIKPAQLLALQTPDGAVLRSITTDAYERVWDYDLAQGIARMCERGTWQAAEAFKQAGGQTVSHAWGEAKPLPLGWIGDRGMFVVLVDYEGAIEHGGRRYARFLMLSNSEVGAASLKLTFGLVDYVCCNFIFWGAVEVYDATMRHTKSILDKWHRLSAGMNKQLSSGGRAEIVRGIEAARSHMLGDKKADVIAMARAATELPEKLVIDAFDRAASTPAYGDPRSVWGMVNGLTEASQHAAANADKRTAIDIKAARLMGLLKRA